ncbi:hypothetical protein A8F94_13615 [Bacillus sp. FJAT-27225]|nr:hypothetical protein A8F94_13615 [Bacillus sp. FJAT-27225]
MERDNLQLEESQFIKRIEIQSIQTWIGHLGKYILYTPMQRAKIAQRTLNFPYAVIGSGLNRIVYDLGNGYVLKVPLSFIGLASNANEFHLYHYAHPDIKQHLCPVIELGLGWIVMKKMDRKMAVNLENLQKIGQLTQKFLLHFIVPVDLMPRNVALTHDNKIIVIDYGLFIPF